MNWRRAINWLLLTFLILDLFLVRMYLMVRADGPGHVGGAALDPDVAVQLEQNQVILATDLPREVPEMAFLRIAAGRPNPYALAYTLFDTLDGVQMSRGQEPLLDIAFSRGNTELQLYSSGVFTYRSSSPGPESSSPDEQRALALAEQFLSRHGGLEGLEPLRSSVYRRQGTHLVEFVQKWEGRPLVGASGAVLIVSPSGVEHAWRRFLTVLGESGNRRPVITAEQALMALALDRPWPTATLTVRQVELGYYNEIYNADEWEAVPVWRIWAGDDTYFYVNAFTGEMESE